MRTKTRYKTQILFPIDISKLDEVIVKSGFKSRRDFSLSLGHEPSWCSHHYNSGTMRKNDILFINEKYGIDIERKEKPKPEMSYDDAYPDMSKTEIDYKKLGEIAGRIIDYDKLAEAMANVIDYDRLSEVICKAMVKALEGDSKPKTFEKRKLE